VVVIMAGGLGTRLTPITDEKSKPMVHVGPRPILETILDNCREHGFKNFYLSVNYKADMVKDYFGDGSRWDVSIRYLEESQRLGTAGPLSLLPKRPVKPFLVMNGDLLTKINLRQLLDFHAEHTAKATICVREYDFQVPYGVVRIKDHYVLSVDEKPVHRFFVNAGIYALDPDTLDLIPSDTLFDMTSLFQRLIEKSYQTAAFPIREYWLDIGRLNDLERAQVDYDGLFK
jgi:NDP-sugar pyrophosphorylase family protein